MKNLLTRPDRWRVFLSHVLASWLVMLILLMIGPPTYAAEALRDLYKLIAAPVYVPCIIILGVLANLMALSLPGWMEAPLTGVVLLCGTYIVLLLVVRARLRRYSDRIYALEQGWEEITPEQHPPRLVWPLRLLLSPWGFVLSVYVLSAYLTMPIFWYVDSHRWKEFNFHATHFLLAPLRLPFSLLAGLGMIIKHWPLRDFIQYPAICAMWKCYFVVLVACFAISFFLARYAQRKIREGKWVKPVTSRVGLRGGNAGTSLSLRRRRLRLLVVVILLALAIARFSAFAFAPEVDIDFVCIPPGEFIMGTPLIDKDYGRAGTFPERRVRISRAFYMGVTEVTQAQWKRVMGTNPSHFEGDDLPVDTVSWRDAVAFCEKLSRMKGKRYRLPTEAEWEYACRAGSQSRFCFGDDPCNLDEYAWHCQNSNWRTHPVRQKRPNAFGLYDMHGNVQEWCSDVYDREYYERSWMVDPPGSDGAILRVVRGGAWCWNGRFCNCDRRDSSFLDYRAATIGFRILMEADE